MLRLNTNLFCGLKSMTDFMPLKIENVHSMLLKLHNL